MQITDINDFISTAAHLLNAPDLILIAVLLANVWLGARRGLVGALYGVLGRIGMIATQASVRSGAYERTLRALDPAVTVIQKACPLFVPLAEEGRTRPGDLVIETVAEEYLASLREEGIDTLILGCTHYPLLKDVIANVMGPGVALIDSGEESAKELQRLLTASDSLGEPQGGGAIYCVSDRVEDFQRLASRFLGEDVAGSARRVEVEDV